MRSASISGLRRPLLAAASGILLSLSFPSTGLWLLVFVALVPLLIVLHEGSPGPGRGPAPRGARWAPLITGVVFNALTFCWIVRLPVHAMTHPWLIYPALLALGLYLGLYAALFGWIVRFARRRIGWPVLLLAPAAWVASEWAKSSGALGCPWGNAGYALAQHPAWIQMASLAGAPGLSFWIVAVNALVAGIFVARSWRTRGACALVALALVWIPVRWGEARLHQAHPRPLIQVALVQPNIASENKWNPAEQDSIVESIYRLTRQATLGEPRPALTIWPETALPFYVRLEPVKLKRVQDLVRETGVPLLAGYPDARLSARGAAATYNAAGLLKANGAFAGQYEKIHLVPFGERIPFQGLFPFLGKIDLGQAEWTPGTRSVVFRGAGPPFGVMICFESIFLDHARKYVLEGADYLVNITNDEWFGKSAGPVQHADMALLRSVELGRATARCANTGISMLIDPYGRIGRKTPLFEQTLLTGAVDAPLEPTLFLQWGDWVTVLSLGIVVALIAIAWFRPIQRLENP